MDSEAIFDMDYLNYWNSNISSACHTIASYAINARTMRYVYDRPPTR